MVMFVSWCGRTLIKHLAVISGPWVNLRHGRRPRDQVTALAKRGTSVGIYQCQFEGTTGLQGGRASDGTGGNWADGCDSPLHTETMVSREGELDLVDEAERQDGVGEGRLHPRLR